MDAKIFLNDLEIISKVLIPEQATILINTFQNNQLQKSADSDMNTMFILNDHPVNQGSVSEYECIIDFKNSIKSQYHKHIRISYINNPDGTIRWMYPESDSFPGFLNFYSSSTLKAKIYKSLVRNTFRFGFKNTIRSGVFTILFKKELNPIIQNILVDGKSFSSFTGTVGLSRKIQIEVHDNNQTECFIKIPFTVFSRELIAREKENLVNINEQSFNIMQVPSILPGNDNDILYSKNIKTNSSVNTNTFTSLHFQALEEMYIQSAHQSVVYSLTCIEQSIKNIYWLNQQSDFKFDKNLLSGLNKILGMVSRNKVVPTSRAHKDFTPWNMYIDCRTLYVFDWEASETDVPLLFDFFHFYFQTGILIQRKSFNEIIQSIQIKLQEPEMQNMIFKYAINTDLHLALYLIIHVSEYLVLYQRQEKLHMQVQWLTKIWNEAIHYVNANHHKSSIRQYFIQDFIAEISNLNYVWMKYEGKNISHISEDTDIDLLIDKNVLNKIINYIHLYDSFARIKLVRKSYMTTVTIYFHNQEFLSIDLIYQFKRNQYVYLNSEIILQNYCLNSDRVKVPQRHHDFLYILLFYTLNNSGVPDKYIQQFSSLLIDEKKGILNYINDKFYTHVKSLDDLMNNNYKVRNKIFRQIKSDIPQNRFFQYLKSLVLYLSDTMIELINNRGFVMTISGVDGAGKSTVIELLKEKLQSKFRKKVKVLRHRPSLFPILSSYVYGKKEAEQKAASTLPRQGQNKSIIGSVARFMYYFMDYQIGQIYVYFKYVRRGYIVIYDRYYFDFIQDGKRTNINLPSAVTGFLYRFIYKPRLNILLYADPQIILKRKQELTEQEITEMTYSYKNLFNKLSKKYERGTYLMIENIHKDDTINEIIENYCDVA